MSQGQCLIPIVEIRSAKSKSVESFTRGDTPSRLEAGCGPGLLQWTLIITCCWLLMHL